MKDYESIKAKILKLHALAERGEQGEAANALRLLNRMLEQYGVTLEQILGEKEETKRYEFKASTEWQRTLLFQIYFFVKSCGTCKYWQWRNEFTFELTAYEYAEFRNMYEWHKEQLGKEIKQTIADFTQAYCYKHDITNHSEQSEELKPMTAEEFERLSRIMVMINNVADTSYRKQLENK